MRQKLWQRAGRLSRSWLRSKQERRQDLWLRIFKEIATACKEQHGIEIDKKKIVLPESLKNFGSYEVTVKLHPQVAAKLTVKVTEA